jgi:TP901 family phage tail tape measure protein
MDFTLKTKVGLDTSNIQSQLDQAGMKAVFTVKTSITSGGTKEVTTYKDALNNTAKTVTTFNAAGQQTSTILKSVKENTSGASTVIGQLGQDFLDTTAKVLKFGASTAVIALFSTAIAGAISTVKDFDAAITDFKKVSDLSGDSLKKYTDQLGVLGDSVARTTTQMVESATEFKKSGYSDEDSAQLAKVAEMYKNIADAELSSGESASFIISQMKAYSNETQDFAQHTIDAVNNISNNMAISSSDVSEGLTKGAAGMSALGNTFEQTAALVSAGAEIMTHQASRVSRGLMTIGNNVAKLAKSSDTMSVATKSGAKSIELINSQTGDLNSTYEVLSQIASQWDNMTKAQQTNLAITLAGKLILARIGLIAGKEIIQYFFCYLFNNNGNLKILIPNY